MSTHYIIRVKDGENFRNSIFPFWGVKKCMKGNVKKMKKGDILWFLTSIPYGGKIIGMAEFVEWHDRREDILQINTKTNVEQKWKGDDDWDIQINYCNLYNTEKQNIIGCIQCAAVILSYETFKNKINGDLYEHYRNFKFYAEPKQFVQVSERE
jgi:hypothetical protein